MKKIIVNPEACIGCGACVAIDPEHFAFNDEGLSNPISNENLESETLMSAIDSCPTSAISIKDVEDDASAEENNTDAEVENVSDNEEKCDGCDGGCCCHKEEI